MKKKEKDYILPWAENLERRNTICKHFSINKKEKGKGKKKISDYVHRKWRNLTSRLTSYLWVLLMARDEKMAKLTTFYSYAAHQWKSTFYVRPLEQVELSFDVSLGSIYGQFGQSSSKEFCFLSHAKEDEWIKDVCGDHFMYRQNGKTSKSVWYSSNEMSFKDELSQKA